MFVLCLYVRSVFGVSVSLYVGICVMIVCVCVHTSVCACVGNRNERVEGKGHVFLLRVVGALRISKSLIPSPKIKQIKLLV